jgi:hypothetical protein
MLTNVSKPKAMISSYDWMIEAGQENLRSFFETTLRNTLPPSVTKQTIHPIAVPNAAGLESS